MADLDDLDYRQRVTQLLGVMQRLSDRQARRALERDYALLTDLRWWPVVLSILAVPPTPRPTLPGLEEMWFPTVPGMPTRTTVTIADAEPLTTAVRNVLSRLSPRRLGPAGAVNLLLTAPDAAAFAAEVKRLTPLMDDPFFDALLTLNIEADGLRLEGFSRQVEALRELLLSIRTQEVLTELAAQIVHARSDREAASRVVRRARTAPQWLQMGLEEMIPRARKGEVVLPLPVALALQRVLVARAEGKDEAALLAALERWQPLRQFVRSYRLLQKAPFRPGEDGLARYGARAKAFFLQLAQVQGAQRAALLQLALAESPTEEEEAITSEPRVLSPEGAQQARTIAAEARQQGQHTLAAKLSAAADWIANLLAELVRPERNPIARLAEQVDNGELSLDEALARVQGAELRQNVRIPHLAALNEQVTHLLRSGDLRRAELLATLNHAAARQTGQAKIHADTALSLAEIKSELGQHEEAIPLFAEAARLAEQMDDSQRLILAVGPMGTAYRDLGNDEEARRCYERALGLARIVGAEGLEIAALGNLADLYLQTGDTEAALSFSEQALALARTIGDTYQMGPALNARAAVLHRTGRLEEAVSLYRGALEALHETTDLGIEARTRLNLGQALAELGRTEEALAELEQAYQLAEQTGNRPLQASALNNIGALYLRRGDLARARDFFEQALAVEGGLGPLERVVCLLRLAGLQMDLEQLTFAGQAIEQAAASAAPLHNVRLDAAVAFCRARYQAERTQWAESEATAQQVLALAQHLSDADLELAALNLLGRICGVQERWEEAEKWYARALDRAQETHRRAEGAAALLHLGAVRAGQRRLSEAESALRAALEQAEALGETSLQFDAHYHLGLLYTDAEDLPRGLEHLRAAIAFLEQQRAALDPIEAFERRYVAARQDVYRLAAETALRLGRPLEALEMLEQGRARLLARRLSQREALPSAVPVALRERFTRTLRAVQVLRNLVYGEPSWGARLMEEVRLGMETLSQARSEEEHAHLVAQARAREQQQMRQALAEAEAELEKIIRQVRQYLPGFDLQVTLPPLDWNEIARDPTTAVVALFTGRQTGTAVLLHPSGVRTVDLPGLCRAEVDRLLYDLPEPLAQVREEVQRQLTRSPDRADFVMSMHLLTLRWMIERATSFQIGWQVALRTLISEKRRADEMERICRWLKERKIPVPEPKKTLFDLEDPQRLTLWQHLLDDVAAGLRARLWQPLLPALRELGVERVVLVPDADLHTLPLTLGLADGVDAPAVAMAPSLRLYAHSLRQLQEQEPQENTLMLIANPAGDLAAADVEADLLRDLFAAHGRVTFALTGEEATMDNVIRTARLGRYWHFAGHARYEWWNPSFSALRLAKREPLPLFWVSIWLDLRATRLAVLSACETGITPVRDPAQEFEGLFSAFLVAGAPAVLASLWPVAELSTALLVHRFYQYHLGDPRAGIPPRPPAEALRDAQQWLRTLPAVEALHHPLVDAVRRRNPGWDSPIWRQLLSLESGVEYPYANPYFWAGFVLAGV